MGVIAVTVEAIISTTGLRTNVELENGAGQETKIYAAMCQILTLSTGRIVILVAVIVQLVITV